VVRNLWSTGHHPAPGDIDSTPLDSKIEQSNGKTKFTVTRKFNTGKDENYIIERVSFT
jgi:hypothetical protein